MKESEDGFFFEVDGKVCSLKVLWFLRTGMQPFITGWGFYERM